MRPRPSPIVAPNGLDHQLRGLLLLPGCSVEEGQLRQVGTWSDRAPEAANPWRNGKRKRVWYNCWKIWGYIKKMSVCLCAIYLCVYASMYIYTVMYVCWTIQYFIHTYTYNHIYIYITVFIWSFIYHIISPTKTALKHKLSPFFLLQMSGLPPTDRDHLRRSREICRPHPLYWHLKWLKPITLR